MEMNLKQELADYRLRCVLRRCIDKLEEMYMRDVAMGMQAEAEKGERQRCEVHFELDSIRHGQVRFRFK